MLKRLLFSALALVVVGVFLSGCAPAGTRGEDFSGRTIRVVATTSMIAELVREVGGDRVEVEGLMGPGVDPHLYKASEGDVTRMSRADVIFYNGLHLEGKMGELFEQMGVLSIPTFALADAVPEEALLVSEYFTGNYDPHIWFDASLWKDAAMLASENLASIDSTSAETYRANAARYAAEIEAADQYVRQQLEVLPDDARVLVTSHDAFGYFGRAYGFEVKGLQGLSTAAEAGTADVADLADFVAEHRVPSLFTESSVSPRGIEAVRAAVRARGFEVRMGGTLYGDALGAPGTPAATYSGMVRSNIDTIIAGLTTPTPES